MAELEKLIDELSALSVLEAAELVQQLEEKWGVSAAAPASAIAVAPTAAAAEPEEEKTEFDLVIKGPGPKKIETIKVIRQITGLGLKESKELAETEGGKIMEAAGKEAAEMPSPSSMRQALKLNWYNQGNARALENLV